MRKTFILMALLGLLVLPLSTLLYAGGSNIKPGSYRFSRFDVPGTPPAAGALGVEQINNLGSIVGYVTTTPFSAGFLRRPNGTIVAILDPLNTGPFMFTEATGVNDLGTIVGYYFDTANAQYSGFIYKNNKYTTYNIPGLPQFSATTILGINNLGSFCGYYQAAPTYATVPYVNWFGHIDTAFSIPGSTFTEPIGINNFGYVAGTYFDTQYHGFIRDRTGAMILIDVPGAAFSGTELLGINDFGWTSGHFWDSGNHEHGFVRSPFGKFYQIDVPGAETTTPGLGTAGGGLNDAGVVVGHFDPSGGGVERGYIAYPGLMRADD